MCTCNDSDQIHKSSHAAVVILRIITVQLHRACEDSSNCASTDVVMLCHVIIQPFETSVLPTIP